MTYKLELIEQELVAKEVKRAIAFAFIASVFCGISPILIRACESYLSPNSTIFNRFWIVTIILGLWSLLRRQKREENSSVQDKPNLKQLLMPLLVLVVAFVGTQLLWAWSLTQTTVANSEILHSLAPGFTILASWMLFSQKFGGKFVIGVVTAIGGTIAIGISDFSSSINLEGDEFALLSAVFYAAYLMSIERLRRWLSSTTVLMCSSVSCTVFCFPVLLITSDEILPHSLGGWLSLILLALSTIFSIGLAAYGLKWLSSGLMATVLLLSPILTAILGFFLFSETLSLLNLLGFVVIMVGIYLAISDKEGTKVIID